MLAHRLADSRAHVPASSGYDDAHVTHGLAHQLLICNLVSRRPKDVVKPSRQTLGFFCSSAEHEGQPRGIVCKIQQDAACNPIGGCTVAKEPLPDDKKHLSANSQRLRVRCGPTRKAKPRLLSGVRGLMWSRFRLGTIGKQNGSRGPRLIQVKAY